MGFPPRTSTYDSEHGKPEERNDRKHARGAGCAAGGGPRRAPRAGSECAERGRSAARRAAVRGRPDDLRPRAGAREVSEPATLSIAEARAHPAQELLESCRARIKRWQPRINAFISAETSAEGKRAGPL